MDVYEEPKTLYEDPNSRMKVQLADRKSHPGLFVLKKYECANLEEANLLVKRAIRSAKDPFPSYAALTDLYLSGHPTTTVTLEFECYMSELPKWFLTKNDRGREKPLLNRYLILQPLYDNPVTGVKIFQAIDLNAHKDVIVKESPRLPKWESANAFLREALIQAAATHERNTELLDVELLPIAFSTNFKAQIVMEALDHDLRNELGSRGEPFAEGDLFKFLFQVTSGLLHIKSKVMSSQKMAHRDIKPANIFIDCSGNFKIGDFGSAWVKHRSKDTKPISPGFASLLDREQYTYTKSGGGTLQYMSPEMRSAVVGRVEINPFASDMFSLGVTFLCMAKLYVPEGVISSDIDSLVRYLDREVGSIAYSEKMKSLMRRMLSVDPNRRPVLEEVHIAAASGLGLYAAVELEVCDCMTSLQLAVEEAKWKAQHQSLKLGMHSQVDIISAFMHLARIHSAQNRKTIAKEFAENARKQLEMHTNEFNPSFAPIYLLLAKIYHDTGISKVAYEYAFKAFDLMQGKLQRSEGYRMIAEIYLSGAYHKEAEDYVKKAIDVYESRDDLEQLPALPPYQAENFDPSRNTGEHHAIASLSRFHPSADCTDVCSSPSEAPESLRHQAALYTTLADVYLAVGRFDEAQKHAEWARDTLETLLSPLHPEVATSYYTLAKIHFDKREMMVAQAEVLRALEIRQQSLGEIHPETAKCYALLSAIELELGIECPAKLHIRKALTISLLTQGELHPTTAAIYAQVALVYMHCSKLHKALAFAEKARLAQVSMLGDQHPAIINTYFVLSRVHRSMKCLKEAEEFGGEAVRISELTLGLKHPLTERVESHLSSLRADRTFPIKAEKKLVKPEIQQYSITPGSSLALQSFQDSYSIENETTPINSHTGTFYTECDEWMISSSYYSSEKGISLGIKEEMLPLDWKGTGLSEKRENAEESVLQMLKR